MGDINFNGSLKPKTKELLFMAYFFSCVHLSPLAAGKVTYPICQLKYYVAMSDAKLLALKHFFLSKVKRNFFPRENH